MSSSRRFLPTIFLIMALLLGCRSWTAVPQTLSGRPEQKPVTPGVPTLPPVLSPTLPDPGSAGEANITIGGEAELIGPVLLGDPAGCQSAQSQAQISNVGDMLAYADRLLFLDRNLADRLFSGSWNAYTEMYDYDQEQVLSIAVDDVKNEYLIQRMLSALHVAGFVAWLRDSNRPEQRRHILAIPLRDPVWEGGSWAPYIKAFWEDPLATPAGDPLVRQALKLAPCAWMVSGGFAPPVDAGWWAIDTPGWPDYASVASGYLAANTEEANRVARKIDWLGNQLEAANTMCGPLSWAILHDAGVFPPGIGGWSAGARVFWLAKPTTNGRPWSLFPPGSYRVYHFDEPIGSFDFDRWPLYPGDFLYTYSEKDGFDHMFIVTEVQPDGSAYTVTNLIKEGEPQQMVIERALLMSRSDPEAGLIRNQWRDRSNGRTGHAGFDVFRWDWMEKDILGQPADYTVQPGDTLGLVALRWKTPADLIARYNGLMPGASLTTGQVLSIPPNPTP